MFVRENDDVCVREDDDVCERENRNDDVAAAVHAVGEARVVLIRRLVSPEPTKSLVNHLSNHWTTTGYKKGPLFAVGQILTSGNTLDR